MFVPCFRVGPGLKAAGHLFGRGGFEKLPGVPVTAVGPGRRSGREQEATPENGNGRFHGDSSISTELTARNRPGRFPAPYRCRKYRPILSRPASILSTSRAYDSRTRSGDPNQSPR